MSSSKRAYVCLSCLLKSGRQSFSTNLRTASNTTPTPKSPSPQSIIFDAPLQPLPSHSQQHSSHNAEDWLSAVSGSEERRSQDVAKADLPVRKNAATPSQSTPKVHGDGLNLDHTVTRKLIRLAGLLQRVSASATSEPSTNLSVREAVKQSTRPLSSEERTVLGRLNKPYGDRDLTGFINEVQRIGQSGSSKPVVEEKLQKLVKEIQQANFFGIGVNYDAESLAKPSPPSKTGNGEQERKPETSEEPRKGGRRRTRTVLSQVSARQVVSKPSGVVRTLQTAADVRATAREKKNADLEKSRDRIAARKKHWADTSAETSEKPKEAAVAPDPFSKLEPDQLQTVKAQDLFISSVEANVLPVPGLSHDLSRVLFNPGIYQLQDPRSRVYNFDPYLQDIMPVNEFDFDALKDYITSSKDGTLGKIASERGRKYVGSSSSMTGMLVHFHFLLSQWRGINTSSISRGFPEKLTSFTAIQRAPSAIFLRWKDGHYAIDADKEYDSANILMSLGRSMEKLLTLEKDDFERYRKSHQTKFSEEERLEPESYHYSEMGKILMRSQLDAYDPRLPGTGMFDLKTRAVVSIRMNTSRHEEGLGYQIKERFGGWESYEREFFDMIRSAFLKYSLQVRMGRMDGIFVAYHNIERIFGFQYVSLPELDLHLHGQSDTTLGDQEFKISLAMLEEVFERATKKFPEQSLRFHFETRNTVTPLMYIFAEPVDEEDIRAIQESKRDEIAEIEKRIYGMPSSQTSSSESGDDTDSQSSPPSSDSSSLDADVTFLDSIGEPLEESMKSQDPSSTDTQSPSSASERPSETKPVLGMTLTIRNKVNGQVVLRPTDLDASDKWSVEYTLVEMDRPGRARDLYSACKNRRKSELAREATEQEDAANYYLKKIKQMTQDGARWRKEQDELDRGREAVVLYGTGRGPEAL